MSNSDKGFGSKSKEEVQEAGRKGGQTSSNSHSTHTTKEEDTDHRKTASRENDDHNTEESSKHGKQGFASMSKEQVEEIARKGGESSHKNR